MQALVKDYGGKVRIVYKNFIVHPQVRIAHMAGCAAGVQGKYSEMEHALWEKGFKGGGFSPEKIDEWAKEVGLDVAKFKADMDGETCKKQMQGDMGQLGKLGVNGTPAFFVNGRFIGGAVPIEVFKTLIDEELKKAEAKVAAGTRPEEYYQKHVVEAGIKELEQPKHEAHN